jgi:hypothetical protein
MEYKTSLDKTAIIITAAVTILFAVIILGQYPLIRDGGRASAIFATVACGLVYAISYGFRPAGYTITPDELVIRRPIGKVHIRREDIRSVEVVDRSEVSGSIRTFGVGGLFGYYGHFANFNLGRMTWYATRRDRPVLIRTVPGKKIIVTPDDREQFVAELNASKQ